MGSDVYLKINDGKNCLHIASLHGHFNLCKSLIEKCNFNVHMADSHGRTALLLSATNGSYNLFSYFADKQIDIHKKDRDSYNSLHIVALHGHLGLCKALVEKYHFDVNMDETNGWTALHFSAKSGSSELVTILHVKELILISKQMMERTVFTLQHIINISTFAKIFSQMLTLIGTALIRTN